MKIPSWLNFRISLSTLITIWKWFKKRKEKIMCFKWFKKKPDPVPIVPGECKKTLLHFAVNNYPGTANDLNGCLNDQRDFVDKLNLLWTSEFDIKRFADTEATASRYKQEAADAIALLHPGATVLVFADSCFSETLTKALNNPGSKKHPTLNRFYQNPDLPVMREKRRIKFAVSPKGEMRWITMSGCGENQTSADAWINKEYHGAFTYYAMLTLSRGMTYRQWWVEIRKCLPSIALDFDQEPGLEGPTALLDKIVFEGEVLIIANSSHGTQVYDIHGDEADGYDEALYLYDGMVTDDEINVFLQKIP